MQRASLCYMMLLCQLARPLSPQRTHMLLGTIQVVPGLHICSNIPFSDEGFGRCSIYLPCRRNTRHCPYATAIRQRPVFSAPCRRYLKSPTLFNLPCTPYVISSKMNDDSSSTMIKLNSSIFSSPSPNPRSGYLVTRKLPTRSPD